MFLILNLILFLKGSPSNTPIGTPNTSHLYVTGELLTILNQIRSKKNLTIEQNVFYDKLIEKSQQLYECQKNLGSKILQHFEIIMEAHNNQILVGNPLETESFRCAIYLNFIDIFLLEMKQDKLLIEFEELMKNPIARIIFLNFENQILLKIHDVIKNTNKSTITACKFFDRFSGTSGIEEIVSSAFNPQFS